MSKNNARTSNGEEAKDDRPIDVQNENLHQPEVCVVKFVKVNKMFPSCHLSIECRWCKHALSGIG